MDFGVLFCEVGKNCYAQHKAGLRVIIMIMMMMMIIGSAFLCVTWPPRDCKQHCYNFGLCCHRISTSYLFAISPYPANVENRVSS